MDEVTPITAVFACDEGYAVPLTVAMRSLLDNCRSSAVELYVIDGGLTERTRHVIEESCGTGRVRFLTPLRIEIPRIEAGWAPHVSVSTYLRFHIPALLPDHRKVLYLDADTLVLEDLARVWSTPLPDDCPFAAVLDVSAPRGPDALREHGFGSRGAYCNAGVLLMNLDVLRREALLDRARAFIERFRPPLADQDALNVLFEHRWLMLPPRWNVQLSRGYRYSRFVSEEEFEQAANEPALVHFSGALKPWHLDGHTLRHGEKWARYAARTAWPEEARFTEEGTRRRLQLFLRGRLEQIEAAHPGFDRRAFLSRLLEGLER